MAVSFVSDFYRQKLIPYTLKYVVCIFSKLENA